MGRCFVCRPSAMRARSSSCWMTWMAAVTLMLFAVTSTACWRKPQRVFVPMVVPCPLAIPVPSLPLISFSEKNSLDDGEVRRLTRFVREYIIYLEHAKDCEKWIAGKTELPK